MRFANIAFFVAAATLGYILSLTLMWQLPFGVFTLTDTTIEEIIALLEKEKAGLNASIYFAKAAMEDLMRWQDVINYVVAVACSLLAIMPALATVWLAEGKLFDRRVDRGWKMMPWMVALGALVVAIHPAPMYIVPYLAIGTLLISSYIVTYQLTMPWQKTKAAQRSNAPVGA